MVFDFMSHYALPLTSSYDLETHLQDIERRRLTEAYNRQRSQRMAVNHDMFLFGDEPLITTVIGPPTQLERQRIADSVNFLFRLLILRTVVRFSSKLFVISFSYNREHSNIHWLRVMTITCHQNPRSSWKKKRLG